MRTLTKTLLAGVLALQAGAALAAARGAPSAPDAAEAGTGGQGNPASAPGR